MSWTACTLDTSPVGTVSLTDSSGFVYSQRIDASEPDAIIDLIADAGTAREAFLSNESACGVQAAAILALAQGR